MKKIFVISLVLMLLAVSVVPVMAANGSGHGGGNGGGTNQGTGGGNSNRTGGNEDQGNNGNNQGQYNQQERDQIRQHEQDQIRQHDQEKFRARDMSGSQGLGKNGNQEHSRMRTPFYLQGTISDVDTISNTLTVTLVHGNAQVKQYIDADLSISATDATQIYQITQNEQPHEDRVPITFDQLAVGQKVAIHGDLVDTIFTARLITVYIH
jgi:hypothetical protein